MSENQNPDQDAGPPGNGIDGADQQGPHPDPPVEEEQTALDDASDDEVDERGKESFPTSDPPSTWAGSDDAR